MRRLYGLAVLSLLVGIGTLFALPLMAADRLKRMRRA